jgi:hypothetical protein
MSLDIKNREVIIKYITNFYDNNKKQFVYKDHSEMAMNYFIIKSLMLLDYDFKMIDPIETIFEFADLEKGGFNSWKNQFDTSSIITTFYGVILLEDIIKYQKLK